MTYEIVWLLPAFKRFKKLPLDIRKRISIHLKEVAINPTEHGTPMVGLKKCWRYRVGKYRIVCKIKANLLIVEVITIGHRGSVYKDLANKL